MKIFLHIARWIVGILFIFSGLIKANDPLGLSYKMQEFFEVWHWDFLNSCTLAFSVIMIVFEIVAGVAVLLGWKMKVFSWLLLLLIVFFTFLTGYALFSGKVRECGCFGDCIPLQAYQSFLKDLALLLLILVIFPFRRSIRPRVRPAVALAVLLLSAVGSFAIQGYVLRHLPLVDCLPYKEGNSLPQKMKAPPGSVSDSSVIVFTYRKNGRNTSFTSDQFPADFDDSYTLVKREDKLVRQGTSAAIKDFTLQTRSGNDTTLTLLAEAGDRLFLFVKDEFPPGSPAWKQTLRSVLQLAEEKHIPGFLVTNLDISGNDPLAGGFPGLVPLKCDGTAIKTAARFNPTLFLIRQGTVIRKWSAPDLDQALSSIRQLR